MFAKSTLTSSTVSCWHSRHIAVLRKLVGNQGYSNLRQADRGASTDGFMPKILICLARVTRKLSFEAQPSETLAQVDGASACSVMIFR